MSKAIWTAVGVLGGFLVLALLLVPFLFSVLGGGYGWGGLGMMGGNMMGGMGLGGMLFGGLGFLLLFGLLIAGVVALVGRTVSLSPPTTTGSGPMRETPLEILQRRYAAGEITREQYEQMKSDIGR